MQTCASTRARECGATWTHGSIPAAAGYLLQVCYLINCSTSFGHLRCCAPVRKPLLEIKGSKSLLSWRRERGKTRRPQKENAKAPYIQANLQTEATQRPNSRCSLTSVRVLWAYFQLQKRRGEDLCCVQAQLVHYASTHQRQAVFFPPSPPRKHQSVNQCQGI